MQDYIITNWITLLLLKIQPHPLLVIYRPLQHLRLVMYRGVRSLC